MGILRSVFFSFFIVISVCSQAEVKPGSIKGSVRLNDGKPAASVSIVIKGTTKGAITADNGTFTIRNLEAGVYELQVSLAGYDNVTERVMVKDDEVSNVVLTLSLSSQELAEVIVQSGRNGYKTDEVSSTLRLNEPIKEISQNIQVITNKVIADQQITSLSDGIIRNVSGVTKLEHWGDLYARINMRGGRASSFRNGMNIMSTWGPLTEDMSFVDHVEFVKGPAGFMMSNGDPSGIYNVVTKRPTGQTKGEVSLLTGSYDFYRSTLDLDGKVSKDGRLLYRLNLMGQTKNSFRPNEYNNRYSLAPVISYKIDDNTTLTAEYVLQHAKMSDVGSYYLFSNKGYETLSRSLTLAEAGLDPTVINDQSLTIHFQHTFNPDWKLTAQAAYFNYQQQGSSLWPSAIDTLYNTVDNAGNLIRSVGIWDAANESKYAQLFVNGDVQTGTVRHRILSGLDMGDKEYMADWSQSHQLDLPGAYFNIYNPLYGSPANGYPSFDRSKNLRQRVGAALYTQQYTGLYLQDELGFFYNLLRLTIAGRFTDVKQRSYNVPSQASKFTPRLGASVSIDRQTTAYALFDQSFQPQSGIRRDGKSVVPVTGNNIEAGIKKDWFGGKWNTSLSAYRILQNNQTLTDPANTSNEYYVVQFGQTKTTGLEFDLRGQILPGLQLIANYALTNSRISRADTSKASQNTIGNKVPGYAKHTANTWLSYTVQSGVLKGIGVNAGFTFLGDRSTWSWGNAGQQGLPDYVKVDGGLTYTKDKFSITANVFNLLNEYLYSGAYYGYGNVYYWQAEAGRNARVGINYRF